MLKSTLMTIAVLSTGMAHAENVEIYVVDMLDGLVRRTLLERGRAVA